MVVGYWWVALFVLVSAAVYAGGVQKKQGLIDALDGQICLLQQQKEALLEEQEDLAREIYSQTDPAYVELTLMKTLGLVPKGSSKVYFYTE